MITLKQYNDNPNLIEELKSTYGQDKLIDIFLNLELMNLRNKLDSSVLCMDELSNEIDLLIDRLNQKINLWDASVFSIDLDTVIRYIKISLLDIVVYNGSYFSMYHDDINVRDLVFKGYTIPYIVDDDIIIIIDIFKWEDR